MDGQGQERCFGIHYTVLRAIYLGCTVNMRHLPRMSDDMAKLADNNGAISDAIPIQRLGLGHEIEFKYCEKKR